MLESMELRLVDEVGVYDTFTQRLQVCGNVRRYLAGADRLADVIAYSSTFLGAGNSGSVRLINFPLNATCTVKGKPCVAALKTERALTSIRSLQSANIYREAIAAICVTDLVLQYVSPHFGMCYAAYETKRYQVDLFLEAINGQSLKDIKSEFAALDEASAVEHLRVFMFQVLHAMLAMRIHLNMEHSDLHPGNIMAMRVEEKAYTYRVGTETYTVPTHGICWVLIDMGRAQSPTLFNKDEITVMLPPTSELRLTIRSLQLPEHLTAFASEVYGVLPTKEEFTVEEELEAKLAWLAKPFAGVPYSAASFDMNKVVEFRVTPQAFLRNFYTKTFTSRSAPQTVDLRALYELLTRRILENIATNNWEWALKALRNPLFQPTEEAASNIAEESIKSAQAAALRIVDPYLSLQVRIGLVLLALEKAAESAKKDYDEIVVLLLAAPGACFITKPKFRGKEYKSIYAIAMAAPLSRRIKQAILKCAQGPHGNAVITDPDAMELDRALKEDEIPLGGCVRSKFSRT